jgi:hypothetical protein
MLSITRALAHRLHTVFRRVLRPGGGSAHLPVVLRADSSGLTVWWQGSEISVAYREPGSFSSEMIVLPLEALKACAGRSPAPVWMEETGPEQVRVQWDMEGFTRTQEYQLTAPDRLPPFPSAPAHFDPAPEDFLAALHEAAQTADTNYGRFTLDRVQVHGKAGEVIGTDGKQLYLASGFRLPFRDAVLLPRLTVLDNRLLRNDGPAEIGLTGTDLCLRLLPEGGREEQWTFSLRLDRESRFPPVDALLASLAECTTRWVLDPAEVVLLQKELPRLPKSSENVARVEVELEESVVVRAGLDGATEEAQITLHRSEVLGARLRVATNPLYLWRAVSLGFTEVRLQGPDRPLLCQDERRKYVWMPFLPSAAAPTAKAGEEGPF